MSTKSKVATKKPTKKSRKVRSDATVASLEKRPGMPSGTIRNPDGRDTRGDKKLGTIRKNGPVSKRSVQARDVTTEEVTLNAFRKTYNRVNARKSQ
jgi:hypothetical protein